MSEIHTPADQSSEVPLATQPAKRDPMPPVQASWYNKTYPKILLEVVLISLGVFLGLLAQEWRESAEHQATARESLMRFRDEFRANRAEIERVHSTHLKQVRDLQAYFAAHGKELMANAADPQKPLPPPPDTTTDSAGLHYSAWEVALANQSLAYIDPSLVAAMSDVYLLQRMYDDSHRAIAQASYSLSSYPFWFFGVATYFGDAATYEELLRTRYDALLLRLNQALGENPDTKK